VEHAQGGLLGLRLVIAGVRIVHIGGPGEERPRRVFGAVLNDQGERVVVLRLLL
jgi:hypothetical protein